MRITNKMMTDNLLYNINGNKNRLNTLSDQYTTGKKIQKPSDDPIVAVRALKLRTNLSELNQYYEKNVPDALSWMDVTEKSMKTMSGILTSMNTYCNQGANDPLTAEDRNSIVVNLEQLKEQIYQEGNANYAGRYVFSGYKTDTSLIFNTRTTNYTYDITEPLSGENIDIITTMEHEVDLDSFDKSNPAAWDAAGNDTMPGTKDVYRLRLAYDDLENTPMTSIDLEYTANDGTVTTQTFPPVPNPAGSALNTISVTNENAYLPGENDINFIPETGELIIGNNLYASLRTATKISVDYTKSEFNQNELRPEHYFNCTVTDSDYPGKPPVVYTKEEQEIRYEINFNQKITVNTQGDDLFTQNIGRMVGEIQNAVNNVTETESKMAEVKKMLEDTTLSTDAVTKLNEIYEQLESEFTLRTSMMQETFSAALTVTENEQDCVNVALSDLGGRYNRLLMTQSRLSSQQVDFEDLLSTNEDADIVDTYVKYTSAETIYNASLSSAAKLTQSTLLDFIR